MANSNLNYSYYPKYLHLADQLPYENPKTWSQHDSNVSWNSLFQLISISLVSIFGSMGGIFMISSIMVIESFSLIGNLYLVSMCLSHLIVTIIILPTSCVAIMAKISDDEEICHFQWLLTLSVLSISAMSWSGVAIDNYYGLYTSYGCSKFRIVTIVLLIWIIGLGIPIAQHIYSWGPSLCQGFSNTIYLEYHITLAVLIILLPTLITIFYFTKCAFRLKDLKMASEYHPSNDPFNYLLTDQSLLKSNMIVYILTLLMWLPLCVVISINTSLPMSTKLLSTSWYLALAHSCGYSLFYAATNKELSEAFCKFFYYCCCKSHVTFTRKAGTRRYASGLRVHIMPGLNMYSQRDQTTRTCQTSTHIHSHPGLAFGGNRNYKTSSDL